MTLPLEGLKVIEFGSVLAGPCAAMHLADQGAEVIKVEPPEGDPARYYAPSFANGLSLAFFTFNRNKRSVVLNLRHPKGLAAVHRLAQWADVVVINMKTGSPERLGIGYEQLAAVNPRIIYASMTYAGERGPEAFLPGIDIVTQARSGILEHHQPPGQAPRTSLFFNFDMANAILAVYGVTLAMLERQRTGKGQKIEVSLLQSAMMMHSTQLTRATPLDQKPVPHAEGPAYPSRLPPDALPSIYQCKDGLYIFFSLPGERWERFCRILGLDKLADDPEYKDPIKRNQHAKGLAKVIADRLATKPAEEWEKMLKADGHVVNVVRRMTDVYDDPQVIANKMITTYEQPGFYPVTTVSTPLWLSATAEEYRFHRPAPLLGEHTFEVLLEMGYSDEDLAEMAAEQVLGQ